MTTLVLGLMPPDADPNQHIAAGPWCFCGQEKAFPDWEKRFKFAPEPLAWPGKLPVACQAAQALCVRMIPQAAAMLVQEPGRWPDAYWQILLSPWLIDLASQIVDRALRSNAMLAAYGNMQLTVDLLPPECEFNFADEHDFTLRGSLGLAFNHWLFSRLLEPRLPAIWQKRTLEPVRETGQKHGENLLKRAAAKGRQALENLTFPLFRGMSIFEAGRFSRSLDHVCHGPDHRLNLEKAFPEPGINLDLPDDLSAIIRAALPESILKLRHPEIAPDKKAPRLKVASLASHENAASRQKLAIWRSQGNRIAHVQHGGNYGQVETPCAAALVEYSQDVFFTWGWASQGKAKGNFVPMPALQLRQLANSWEPGEKLIFVGTEMPAYGRRLDSHPTPLQYLRYRQAKAKFFQALGSDLLKNSLYRPYFSLPGTLLDAEWLLPQFPDLSLCEGNLLEQIKSCRLLAVDHHGTTLLEAMATNVPVIAYWRREFWPLCPECDILLDLLKEAGIWHENAESAAQKARRVWNDVQAWQNSGSVQLARRVFCQNQARICANPEKIWLETLKKL